MLLRLVHGLRQVKLRLHQLATLLLQLAIGLPQVKPRLLQGELRLLRLALPLTELHLLQKVFQGQILRLLEIQTISPSHQTSPLPLVLPPQESNLVSVEK
jgi:hypothetical protein